ncbi:hypothetical protein GCM10011586_20560 [Silvibacterium dinghuense]|nr:hypothetical protein GCM10011586_20560 [Silvibacterium dinghuense]
MPATAALAVNSRNEGTTKLLNKKSQQQRQQAKHKRRKGDRSRPRRLNVCVLLAGRLLLIT